MKFELLPFALPADYGIEIISLAAAKAHLYIEAADSDDDGLITVMIDAAIDMTEKFCEVKLAPIPGMIWHSESFGSPLKLGLREIREIESIDYLDTNGDPASLAPALARIGLGGEILPAVGTAWPDDVGGQVKITFTAGFEAGKIPPTLISATKMFLAQLYAHRETVIMGGVIEVPLGFQMQCSLFSDPHI
jgi:uncharacterized phiE125 gp8 family phage protein